MHYASIFTLLGAARFVSALTINPRQAPARTDPQSPDLFKLFAQFSIASYCPTVHDSGVNTSVCTTDKQGTPCAGFEDVRTSAEFTGDGPNGIGGFVAVDRAQSRIVVILKGTDNIQNVVSDVELPQVDSNLCAGCKVHQGFNQGFENVKPQMEKALMAEMNKTGQENFGVVVAGHSLGAAVATIAGASLRKQGVALDMYLYGSPFVGNDKLAALVASQPGFTARITNRKDIVTAIPTAGPTVGIPPVQPYAHIFPEFYYERGLALPNLYKDGLRVCHSPGECTSAKCAELSNGPALLSCDIRDHGGYAGGSQDGVAVFAPCGGESDPLEKFLFSLI